MIDMIYGKRQQGKSTLAFSIAIAEHNRVVIWDPSGNFPVVRRIEISEVAEWLRFTRDDKKDYHFARVTGFKTEEIEGRFAEFSEQLFHGDDFEQGVSVIVDEAHMLQGANYVNPSLDRMQRKIPSNSTLIETTHRIVDTDVNTRYHVQVFFFFYADLPRELKKIAEDFGPDVAAEIPKLKRFEVIQWERPQGQKAKWEVWKNPSEWYIDIGNQNQ